MAFDANLTSDLLFFSPGPIRTWKTPKYHKK